MPDDDSTVKLHFSNTFNCKPRDIPLVTIANALPAISRFCLTYHLTSSLKYGLQAINSQGVQQGSLLQWLLIGLAVHTNLLSLASTLAIGCLDDFMPGGPGSWLSAVTAEVATIRSKEASLGLDLNLSNC